MVILVVVLLFDEDKEEMEMVGGERRPKAHRRLAGGGGVPRVQCWRPVESEGERVREINLKSGGEREEEKESRI